MTSFSPPQTNRLAAVLAGVLLAFALPYAQIVAAADELPTFRAGSWYFHRTLSGRNMESTKCTNPSEDMLQKAGCTISSVKKSEDGTFSFVADCPPVEPRIPQLGGRANVVLTVVSDSFYKVVSVGQSNGKATKEFLDARRVGDCVAK